MKFSDALRGAADRAPVEQLHVSAADAAGRVKRERALRMGGNGLVGAGAVAVIALGAAGPLGGLAASDESFDAAPAMDAGVAQEDIGTMEGADGSAGSMMRPAEQWMCGAAFDPADGAWSWGDVSGVTFTAGEPERDGDEIQLPTTLEAQRPVDLISFADTVVTWDGIVVGRMVEPSPIQYGPADEPMLPEGEIYERLVPGSDFESLESWTVLNTVNCWDGEPLPAADYEVHLAQTLAYADDATEPSVEPDVAVEEGDGEMIEPAMAEVFRVAAEPVSLTIDGEQSEDPFAKYLGGDTPVEPVPLPEPIQPEPLPDGYLTPELARELFEANRTDGAWDMAEGSQRWLKVSDSTSAGDDWSSNFYGCSWEGQGAATFPSTSATMGLLDVTVDLPARLGVSYGFVVDGNPLVSSSVANMSEYTIPGFWTAQPQLFLVRDGRVVAEAYPTSLEQQGMGIARSALGTEEGISSMIAPIDGGALEPGDSVSGDFLWRDVTGCYTESGPGPVDSGTYTVLAMQSVSISSAYYGMSEPQVLPYDSALVGPTVEDALVDPRAGGDVLGKEDAEAAPFSELTIGGQSEPGIAIAPVPDQGDWVELQAWTSLGTITVSSR